MWAGAFYSITLEWLMYTSFDEIGSWELFQFLALCTSYYASKKRIDFIWSNESHIVFQLSIQLAHTSERPNVFLPY